MKENCYICGCPLAVKEEVPGRPIFHFECAACGHYQISRQLYAAKSNIEDGRRYIVSAFIRENSSKAQPISLGMDNIKELANFDAVPRTPMDKMNRIMHYLGSVSTEAGAGIAIDSEIDYPIAYAKSPAEFEFLMENLKNTGLVDFVGDTSHDELRITIDGWKYLIEFSTKSKVSGEAFVAMWFNKDMDMAWDKGFRPALEKCGYKAVRIDLVHHNEKICDRIVSEIRRAGLLVADCTGQRMNVFFEAGFAVGLGTPVIWTCRSDYMKELPFDTRQYNHVEWKDEMELYEKLVDRIMATGLGRD